MGWFQLIGICLLASVLVVILKPMNPVIASLLTAAFGVMIIGAMLPEIQRFIEVIRQFLMEMGLEGGYYALMLKVMGIVFVAQLAEQVCRDMGAQAVAERVELCGRIAIMGIVVPLFIDLTRMVIDVLR